jgi:hypothetical protein
MRFLTLKLGKGGKADEQIWDTCIWDRLVFDHGMV